MMIDVSALTRISGQRKIDREFQYFWRAGYYSSLIVSRNSLRFNFAPLILLPRAFPAMESAFCSVTSAKCGILIPSSLRLCRFFYIREAWLSLSFLPSMYISFSSHLSPSLLCMRVILLATASPRFERCASADAYAERCLNPSPARSTLRPPPRSPFRRVHYAMRILEERRVLSVRRVGVSEVARTRKHFLLARVMVCLKLDYRKCRTILDD